MEIINIVGVVGKLERRDYGMSIQVACNRREKNSSGEYADVATWYSGMIYGKDAERAEKALQKGHRIALVGELKVKKLDDGRMFLNVDVRSWEPLWKAEKRGGYEQAAAAPQHAEPGSDDLPF